MTARRRPSDVVSPLAGTTPDPAGTTPAPSPQIARDMVRRGLLVFPFVLAAAWLLGGRAVAASVAYGFVLILANFLLSAFLLAWAARISLGLVASVVLGGYVVRMGLIFAAVWTVREALWVRMLPLGVTIIATHLGLLVWEIRHVSATAAHPGLKPRSGGGLTRRRARPAAGYRPERHRPTTPLDRTVR